MAKKLLKFTFIFDPAGVWASEREFTRDMGRYFSSKGYIAHVVQTEVGNPEETVVLLEHFQGEQVKTVKNRVKKIDI